MEKSKEIKMTYEQAQQLAGYIAHLRGNIDRENKMPQFFKRTLGPNGEGMSRSVVRKRVVEYVNALEDANNQTVVVLSIVEQALLNSNDKDKVDELFGVKK